MSKKKTENLDLDEEILMFCAYRYAIGRKTYVSTLAPYIAKKYYPLLSDERAEFTAMDIRRSIADCLRYGHPSFVYDVSVFDKDRNPIADYLTWLNANVQDSKDLQCITNVTCYKENYNPETPKSFAVDRTQRKTWECYQSDIDDLLTWDSLASCLDRANHVNVTVECEGKDVIIRCFETWRHLNVPCKDNPMYYQRVPWKWVKCYVSVDRYLKMGDYCGALVDEYVKKVEKVNKV